VLICLFLALSSIILYWLYLHLSNPTIHETFTLAPSETATRELNLGSSEYAFIWLSTIPLGMSGRSAMGWVIKFYVVDPNDREILRDPGIAGTGFFNPLSFVAQQDGVYTLYFDNSIGDPIDKIVSLSYRKTQSILGASAEHLLLYMSITTIILILIVAVIVLIKKT